jgi:hypothetical protein
MEAVIVNAVGQKVWEGTVTRQTELSVTTWARGVYYIRLIDLSAGNKIVKPLILE